MYHRSEECTVRKTSVANGNGLLHIKDLAAKEEMYGHVRLFSHIIVPPGCSIGTHNHEHETEFYYILKGQAAFDDNGTEVILHAGDISATGYGQSHGLVNRSESDVELIALIVLET